MRQDVQRSDEEIVAAASEAVLPQSELSTINHVIIEARLDALRPSHLRGCHMTPHIVEKVREEGGRFPNVEKLGYRVRSLLISRLEKQLEKLEK